MWRNNLRPTSPSARTTGTGKGTGYIDTGTVVATTGTINSSRPEHTKRTQGNAEQHKATHAGQAEPTQPKQHQQTKNRTPRIPNTTRNHQRPKTETYAPTASRSHRNHHPRPTSTTPSKPTKPAKDHPGSYPSPPSAPDAYKQRPSTSRHHSVWSVCPVLSRISQYVRQPDERVGTPRP